MLPRLVLNSLNGVAKELTCIVSFKATIFARNKDCDFNNLFINDVVGEY